LYDCEFLEDNVLECNDGYMDLYGDWEVSYSYYGTSVCQETTFWAYGEYYDTNYDFECVHFSCEDTLECGWNIWSDDYDYDAYYNCTNGECEVNCDESSSFGKEHNNPCGDFSYSEDINSPENIEHYGPNGYLYDCEFLEENVVECNDGYMDLYGDWEVSFYGAEGCQETTFWAYGEYDDEKYDFECVHFSCEDTLECDWNIWEEAYYSDDYPSGYYSDTYYSCTNGECEVNCDEDGYGKVHD
jgi:hypothetical protein